MNGKLRNMTSVFLYDREGILCLYRIGSKVANEMYVGSAGGHFEKDELCDAKACALRELQEELGLTEIPNIKLRYVTCRLKNGELRNNYYFFSPCDRTVPLTSNEGTLRWFSWEEAKHIKMPVSARHMMDHYLSVGRFDDKLYGTMTEPGGSRFVEMKEFDD